MSNPELDNTSTEPLTNPSTLFDEYNLRLVDIGVGPVLLTSEGQSIFAGHIRMQRAQQIAGILGYLVHERMRQPVTENVVVFEPDLSERPGEDAHAYHERLWMAGQAAKCTPDYIGLGIDSFKLEDHQVVDENGHEVCEINEVPLPDGGFLSTHNGLRICKVLLSPHSILTHMTAPTATSEE
ncbi:hypothetical protein EYC59_05945 [Candidatus Saccharibacteria bacterium]|nr:MAG: hypothetical protein EYC59_05945 [Candidatus Saccharibacteria bacterium]